MVGWDEPEPDGEWATAYTDVPWIWREPLRAISRMQTGAFAYDIAEQLGLREPDFIEGHCLFLIRLAHAMDRGSDPLQMAHSAIGDNMSVDEAIDLLVRFGWGNVRIQQATPVSRVALEVRATLARQLEPKIEKTLRRWARMGHK